MNSISNAINMSFRVNKNLKKQADELFKKLGLNTSVALNMFLSQCVREQGLPFVSSIENPSTKLLNAIEEAKKIENGDVKSKKYNNFNEVLKDLNI